MTKIVEPKHLSDFLAHEGDNMYSRDTVTIASGQNLLMGAVVGALDVDGKVVQFNQSKTDGAQKVRGILIYDVDATAGDQAAVIIARHATVKPKGLVWRAGTDNAPGAIGLTALGIIIREQA